jgi:plasmid rolling circle replication initiator protein Rep
MAERSICNKCCVKCTSDNALRWQIKNREKCRTKSTAWRIANREKYLEIKRLWRQRHPDRVVEERNRRRANKLRAMPKWLKWGELRKVYNKCRQMTRETGQEYHVDHIVPLVNKRVCGLHVPWNLRIITAAENVQKNNKHVFTSGGATLSGITTTQVVETNFHQIEISATDLV